MGGSAEVDTVNGMVPCGEVLDCLQPDTTHKRVQFEEIIFYGDSYSEGSIVLSGGDFVTYTGSSGI